MPFCCREEPGCHLAAPFELTCLQDLPPPSQGTGWAELLGPGGQPPRCRLSHQLTAFLGRTPHSIRQLCDRRHVTQALCAPSGLVCQMGPGMLTPVNRTDNRERKARGAGAWRAAEAQSTVTALGGCYATARQGRAARPCREGQPPPGMDGRAGNALTEAAAAELGPAGVGAGTRGAASWGQGTARAEASGQGRGCWEPRKLKQDRGAGAVPRGPWSPECIGHATKPMGDPVSQLRYLGLRRQSALPKVEGHTAKAGLRPRPGPFPPRGSASVASAGGAGVGGPTAQHSASLRAPLPGVPGHVLPQ